MPLVEVAERAGVERKALARLEKGKPSVLTVTFGAAVCFLRGEQHCGAARVRS